jgi:hypothetical protein
MISRGKCKVQCGKWKKAVQGGIANVPVALLRQLAAAVNTSDGLEFQQKTVL